MIKKLLLSTIFKNVNQDFHEEFLIVGGLCLADLQQRCEVKAPSATTFGLAVHIIPNCKTIEQDLQ